MKAARRPLPVWADIVLLPLVNVALAFVTVGIIVLVIGVNPFHALELLAVGALGSPESIGYTKDARAAPIPVLSSEGRLASYDLSCDRILCDGAIAVIE